MFEIMSINEGYDMMKRPVEFINWKQCIYYLIKTTMSSWERVT